MSALKKYEIDAIFNQVKKKVDEKNRSFVIEDNVIEDYITSEFPEIAESKVLREQGGELYAQASKLEEIAKLKANCGHSYQWEKVIEKFARKELLLSEGYIDVDYDDLKDQIILASGANLKEVLENVLNELNLS